jgi:hypothetical protein
VILKVITKKELISEVRHHALIENVQAAEKHYFKTGKLNNFDRQEIFKITGGDNYTKFIADVYDYWKGWAVKNGHTTIDEPTMKWIVEIYNDLKNYNPNVFPVVELDVTNANAERNAYFGHNRGNARTSLSDKEHI